MPGLDGMSLARALAAQQPAPAVIFCTAWPDQALAWLGLGVAAAAGLVALMLLWRWAVGTVLVGVIALVIIVLARPQSTNRWQNVTTEGIDIMVALDISSSMLAQDLRLRFVAQHAKHVRRPHRLCCHLRPPLYGYQ